jgi:hypothetical protein
MRDEFELEHQEAGEDGTKSLSWLQIVQHGDRMLFTPYQAYQASLYWAFATITSVGYGDISASNSTERLVASFALLGGGLIWVRRCSKCCSAL